MNDAFGCESDAVFIDFLEGRGASQSFEDFFLSFRFQNDFHGVSPFKSFSDQTTTWQIIPYFPIVR